MTEKIARWIAIGGVFAVLLIPLFVTTSMYFPYITGKNFAFRIIVELMLMAWAVLALLVPAYRPKRSWIMIAIAAFIVVIGIADMFGEHVSRSFWSNFERMEGFIALLHIAGFLLVAGTVMQTEKLWGWLWNSSLIVATALALKSFTELSAGAQGELIRVDATLGNPTYFAVYLLFNIFIALVLLYRHHRNRTQLISYGIVALIQMVALYYTGTRGTLLGIIAGGVVAAGMLFFGGRARHPRLRTGAGIALGLILLFGGTFIAVRNTSFIQESPILSRFADISLTETTVESRITLWTSIGWEGFKERPILGWGQDNFIVVFGKYYDPIMYKQEPWFDRAHNVFVDWLIAGGALGLLGYLFLFGAGLFLLWRGSLPLPERALITGLFTAYFVHNLFVFDNLVSYIYFAMLLAYLHARSTYIEVPETARVKKVLAVGSALRPELIGTAGVIAALALIYFVNVPYIARAQTLIDALRADLAKRYDEVLPAYNEALEGGGVGIEEAKEQLSQSTVRIWKSEAEPETKQTMVERARRELEGSIERDPGNTRPLFFLGNLLSETDAHEEAIEVFERALSINPARQMFIHEIALIYLERGEFDKVIVTFKEAYEKAPENNEAFAHYVGGLIFAGRVAEGEAELMERFGTTTVDNPIIINGYRKQGRIDRIAPILEDRLAKILPQDNFQLRVSLAAIYIQLGDRERAIPHLERAVELDTSFAEQGIQIVEALKAGKNVKLQ